MSGATPKAGSPAATAEGAEARNGQPQERWRWVKDYQLLIALVAQGIVWLLFWQASERDEYRERVIDLEKRVTHIEYKIESMEQAVARIEGSVADLNSKVDRILLQRLGSSDGRPSIEAD